MEEHPKILVPEWWKDSQNQSEVRSAIEEVLDMTLPESYDRVKFKKTCEKAYALIYEYASKGRKYAA